MTRDEFIAKLPDLNMKDAIIRLVDQGVELYGFQTEEKIGKWYDDCSNLLSESSSFLPVFQQAIVNRLDTARYLLYTHVIADRSDFFIMDKADVVHQRIMRIQSSDSVQNLKLMNVTDVTILKKISIVYYWFYEHRKAYLAQLVAEFQDEIAFREVLEYLKGQNQKTGEPNHINGVRIDINKARGRFVDINSNRAIKLLEDVILPQFYDRYSQLTLNMDELKNEIKVCKLADQRTTLRTVHEMYRVFVEEGYLTFENDKDLYMLGQKNYKYVTTKNSVTDWVYTIFAALSSKYSVNACEDDRRKTVRDNLKRYAKIYHQDDALFPDYNIERLKRVYIDS